MLDFHTWNTLVDDYLIQLVGIPFSQLPEGRSWSAWNMGIPPEDYAIDLLRNAGHHV